MNSTFEKLMLYADAWKHHPKTGEMTREIIIYCADKGRLDQARGAVCGGCSAYSRCDKKIQTGRIREGIEVPYVLKETVTVQPVKYVPEGMGKRASRGRIEEHPDENNRNCSAGRFLDILETEFNW